MELPKKDVVGRGRSVTLFSPRRMSIFLHSSAPDPWEIQDTSRSYEWIKLFITALTLFPLRIMIFFLSFGLAILLSIIGTIGLKTPKKLEDTIPLGKYRTFIRLLFRLNLRFFLVGFGVWWVNKTELEEKKEPYQILIANHIAYLDALYIAYTYDFCPVVKAEILSWPLIGRMVRLFQPIPVARDSKTSRHDVKMEIERRTRAGSGFPPVLVFPEGTTTNGRVLIKFKIGPFAPGVPVKPVCISYPHKYLDLGNSDFGRLLRSMFEFRNYLKEISLPVYHPSQEEINDASLYADNVRAKMSEIMELPVTQHSYEDLFLYKTAHGAGISQDFEMSKISEIFDLSWEEVKKIIIKFRHLDHTKDGLLTIGDFSKAFGFESKPPPHIERMFDILDYKQTGMIDFREFLYGVALLRDDTKIDQKISIAFQMYDLNGDGKLSKEKIREVVKLAQSSGLLDSGTGVVTEINTDNQGRILFTSDANLENRSSHELDVDALFEEFDEDKDGFINEEQFKRALLGGKFGELVDWPVRLMKNTVFLSPRPDIPVVVTKPEKK